MPRKGLRPRDRRPLPAPDYKYNSVLVARFINKLNFEGKTATAARILDDAMDIIAQKTKENAYVRAYYCQNGNSKRVNECKHLILNEGVLLKDLIAATNSDTLYTLEIKSAKGAIFLSQEESASLICTYRLYDNVGTICQDLFP